MSVFGQKETNRNGRIKKQRFGSHQEWVAKKSTLCLLQNHVLDKYVDANCCNCVELLRLKMNVILRALAKVLQFCLISCAYYSSIVFFNWMRLIERIFV